MKKLFFISIAFTLLFLEGTAKNYLVRSESEIKQILPVILPGDVITIANGSYENWEVNLSVNGTKNQPVIIKSQTVGKVVFGGKVGQAVFRLSGAFIRLEGITFKNCQLIKDKGKNGVLVEMAAASSCAVVNCSFIENQATAQFMPLLIISGNGHQNMVQKCLFQSNVDCQDVQVKVTKESCPQNSLITRNLFKHKARVSWPNGNGGECVQIGQDPILLGNVVANATVSYNTCIKCDAENEVVSNKSSKNKYVYNTFHNNDGELVMRGGHDCVISYNKFIGGTGGIRINGTGHIVTHNRIKNISTAIRLLYGMAKGKEATGFYVAASDCSINNNLITNATIGILVGDSKDEDWTGKFDVKRYPSPVLRNIAPFNNQIQGNTISKTKNEVVVID